MKEKEEHSLKELVVKLNDRNIQRQRESGLTIYAIVGVVLYIIFYIIQETPRFLSTNEMTPNLIVLTIIGNMLFCAICLVVILFKTRSNEFMRIFPNEDFFTLNIDLIPVLASCVALAVLNFYSYHHSYTKSYTYILFCALNGLNFVTPILLKIAVEVSTRNVVDKVPDFIPFNPKGLLALKIIIVVWGLALSIPIAILTVNEDVGLSPDQIAFAVKFAVHLIGFIFLVVMSLQLVETKYHNDGLEQLEKEIYLRNLSNDEIKIRLEDEYFGQGLSTWAANRKERIAQNFEKWTNELKLNNEAVPAISERGSRGELLELTNKLLTEKAETIKSFSMFHKDFDAQINRMLDFSSIGKEDWKVLKDLHDYYLKEVQNLTSYENRLAEFIDYVKNMKIEQ